MDPFITQCPNCQTSFRVTPEQVEVANGSVRCGSCMHIFQAINHKLNEESEEELDELDLNISFDDEEEDEIDFPAPPAQVADVDEAEKTSEFSNSYLNLDQVEGSVFKELDEISTTQGFSVTDEVWAKQLLENLEDENTLKEESSAAPAQSLDQAFEEEDFGEDNFGEDEGELAAVFDEQASWDEPAQQTATDKTAEDDAASSEEASREESSENLTGEPYISDDLAGINEVPREEIITHIEPEPLEFQIDPEKYKLLRRTLWGFALTAACLSLSIQYAWFNRDEMASRPAYRPWYEWTCKLTGCQLPPQQDFQKISARNLVVRSHPRVKSALIVDAIVINQASYQQAFPILELIFTDIRGEVIAGRRFKPNEYLQGELSGVTEMPSGRPIHLSLEIIDPGDKANSYTLQLHPNQST